MHFKWFLIQKSIVDSKLPKHLYSIKKVPKSNAIDEWQNQQIDNILIGNVNLSSTY